jgi:hypothetical protein
LLLRRCALRGLKPPSPSVLGARWNSHDADAVYEQMRRRELQEYAGWRQGGQAATAASWRRVAYPPTSHRVSHTLEQFVKDFDSLKVKEKAQRSVQLSGASCGHGAESAALRAQDASSGVAMPARNSSSWTSRRDPQARTVLNCFMLRG